jgi:catechol 2,3-dioxygenase-like lactoylglutathione lyase family enzyme
MKRLHLHVGVDDLAASVRFYEALFDAAPTVLHGDYAKWMLDDPRVNFAISARARAAGIDHVGIQTDSAEELGTLAMRLKAAGNEAFDQEATTCCYARSDKSWVRDPSGLRWETFHTFGDATSYGEDEALAEPGGGACCGPADAPAPAPAKACCR